MYTLLNYNAVDVRQKHNTSILRVACRMLLLVPLSDEWVGSHLLGCVC
jgi:hypothetical protein